MPLAETSLYLCVLDGVGFCSLNEPGFQEQKCTHSVQTVVGKVGNCLVHAATGIIISTFGFMHKGG